MGRCSSKVRTWMKVPVLVAGMGVLVAAALLTPPVALGQWARPAPGAPYEGREAGPAPRQDSARGTVHAHTP